MTFKAKAFRHPVWLKQSAEGRNDPVTFNVRDAHQEISKRAAARPSNKTGEVGEDIHKSSLLAPAFDEASSSQSLPELVLADANRRIDSARIESDPRVFDGAANKIAYVVRAVRVVRTHSEPAPRPEDTQNFGQRPRLVFNPVEDAVEVNDIKRFVGKFAKVFSATDPGFEVSVRFGLCNFDSQRQWIDGQGRAAASDDAGNVGCKPTRARTDIKDAFAFSNIQARNQQLPLLELPDADFVIGCRELR